MMTFDKDQLSAIQSNFHKVINDRAGHLIKKYEVPLPVLSSPFPTAENSAWFPVPGMYGGFSYWFEERDKLTLISESWCRIAYGSGLRHEITATSVVESTIEGV
jgi:hypothetical protein